MRTTNRRFMGFSAAGLVIVAGAVASWNSAFAEPTTDPSSSPRTSAAAVNANGAPVNVTDVVIGDFYKGSDLRGKSVANRNGEVIGEIQDFIFDRGTGQIEYTLIKSGSVLGMGGKTIAVAYPSFGYDSAQHRFTLDMTKEQIGRAGEFVPANWSELHHTTWADHLDAMLGNVDETITGREYEPDAADMTSAPEEHIKGTITNVRRDSSMLSEERVHAVVTTTDGKTREICLGPSWYVMGSDAAPMRGDAIDATVRTVNKGGHSALVATQATIDGKKITLRDKAMNPEWRLPRDDRSAAAKSQSYAEGTGRLMLLSDLIGAKASASDKDTGEVQDVIIERQSGRIAMIGFDPNDNIMGLGDKIRMVPWGVLSVRGDETVSIDATQDMLRSGQAMPENVSNYAYPAQLEPVYRPFQIDTYRFVPLNDDGRSRVSTGGPATETDKYAWIDASKRGKEKSLTGKVVSDESVVISPGEPQSHIVIVQSNGARERIVLGPSWYLERQNLKVGANDNVVVNGRVVNINGQDYLVARTVTINGTDVQLWNGDSPVWITR